MMINAVNAKLAELRVDTQPIDEQVGPDRRPRFGLFARTAAIGSIGLLGAVVAPQIGVPIPNGTPQASAAEAQRTSYTQIATAKASPKRPGYAGRLVSLDQQHEILTDQFPVPYKYPRIIDQLLRIYAYTGCNQKMSAPLYLELVRKIDNHDNEFLASLKPPADIGEVYAFNLIMDGIGNRLDLMLPGCEPSDTEPTQRLTVSSKAVLYDTENTVNAMLAKTGCRGVAGQRDMDWITASIRMSTYPKNRGLFKSYRWAFKPPISALTSAGALRNEFPVPKPLLGRTATIYTPLCKPRAQAGPGTELVTSYRAVLANAKNESFYEGLNIDTGALKFFVRNLRPPYYP